MATMSYADAALQSMQRATLHAAVEDGDPCMLVLQFQLNTHEQLVCMCAAVPMHG
jgi:hypothetical protein